ncbi:MAG: EF2563 family selenium-dependent molybdenum hydroxylase system protein [Armatimonadetes bacterium]|nr:EF2563 family selenium-dependent molybdenum hydroxylase system protein [Armatimonadota bacterium]
MFDSLVLIRGGGDLGSGTVHRLHESGFRNLFVLETGQPLAIRRTVCFSEAIFSWACEVEGVKAVRVHTPDEKPAGMVGVVVDPQGVWIRRACCDILIDARMRKCESDARISDAPIVIGLGPGFEAGVHAHAVIETMRGHTLGRVIRQGRTLPNTGKPGEIGGQDVLRVLRAPCDGVIEKCAVIGDRVKEGQVLAEVCGIPIRAPISGLLRGFLRSGLQVERGLKVGDIDPRTDVDIHLISDKSRAVAGGVLEGILSLWNAAVACHIRQNGGIHSS